MITYTSITAGKDKPREDITVLSGYNKFVSPVMNAKIYKVLAHKYLDTDISLWLDGNIYPLVPPEQLVAEWLGDADMAIFEHYHHWKMSKEVEVIKMIFKRRTPWVRDEVQEQLEHYKDYGDMDLFMGGMILRRHNEKTARFNEAWWAEICRWSQRDQLSLPVILKQFPDLKVNFIKGSIKNHPYLRYDNHEHFYT
jgi:hypothetical protein